jgi:hypothetical protein
MSDIVIVKMHHVRQLHCSRGAREFCKQNNLDWTSFLNNGIESDILERTNDYMALQVVEIAKQEAINNG